MRKRQFQSRSTEAASWAANGRAVRSVIWGARGAEVEGPYRHKEQVNLTPLINM
jgi:hypothetical protein